MKAGLKCVDDTAKHYEQQVGKVSRGEETNLDQMEVYVQRFADLVDKDTSLGPLVADFQSESYQHESKQVIKTSVLAVAIANHLNCPPDG